MTSATVPLMMSPLVASGVLAVGGRRLGHRLPPATAVRLLSAAALVTALSTGFVLTVAGFLAVAQLPPVAALGAWSARAVGATEPFPPVLGAACGVLGVALLGAALRELLAAWRDLAAATATCRRLGPGVDGLVVVDDDVPDAFALPGPGGRGGRTVVSTGMLRALSPAERRVLLAHEAAHLRHRHHLYLQVAGLSAAANPLLRPLAGAVRSAVERWADEDAARVVGDRSAVARAVARAGLAAHRPTPGAGDGRRPRLALRMAEHQVVGRARAMLEPAPGPRRVLAVSVVALVLAAAAGAVDTGQHAERLVEAARSALVTRP